MTKELNLLELVSVTVNWYCWNFESSGKLYCNTYCYC